MSSYNAIVSTIVHFETYRNIDLLHQGLYFLRAQLYSETGNVPGLVLDTYQSPHATKAKKAKIDYHSILPSVTTDTSFSTKVFTIRYCEEEVELNDVCEFRVEIPVTPKYLETNYILEVQLHFGELTKIGGVEELSRHVQEVKDAVEFKQVAMQRVLIHGIAKGIAQYFRAQNDGAYYGSCNMTVHSSIVDFRYRVVPTETVLAMRKGPAVGAPASTKTLGDFLFSNPDGSMPAQVSSLEVDRIYTDYVKVLVGSYEKLKDRFLDIQKRCLNDKQRRDNCMLLMCKDLVLPGEEGDEEIFALQDDAPQDAENVESEETKQREGGGVPAKEGEENQSRLKTEHEDASECNITNEVSQLENYKKLDMMPGGRKEEKKAKVSPQLEGSPSLASGELLTGAADMDERTSSKIVVPRFKPNQRSILDAPSVEHKSRPKYSLKTSSQDPYKCAAKFALNITLISGQILELWQKYIELITITPRFITEMLSFEYVKCVTTQKYPCQYHIGTVDGDNACFGRCSTPRTSPTPTTTQTWRKCTRAWRNSAGQCFRPTSWYRRKSQANIGRGGDIDDKARGVADHVRADLHQDCRQSLRHAFRRLPFRSSVHHGLGPGQRNTLDSAGARVPGELFRHACAQEQPFHPPS